VLYDAGCRLCRTAQQWLASRDQLVPLRFVPAGSRQARRRFPLLDHRASRREVTVVADTGDIWVGDSAWLTCLWALASYRGLAHRLATPRLRPLAGRVVSAAAAWRDRQYRGTDDRSACADQCHR
jgi:predicted DCC family thiol-disulfide oxidoreductase YuxK